MTFKVTELDGSAPDLEQIVLHETWAYGLIYCDVDEFAMSQTGELLLLDDCGNFASPPLSRFKVEMGDWK